MLYPIVIMRKGIACVVRRVYKYALNLARVLLLERLQRQQVIAKYQLIVEDIALTDAVLCVIAPLRLVQQDAGL